MPANTLTPGLATLELKVNGTAFADAYYIISVTVVNELYRITTATIVIADGSAATQDFPISDSATFIPGARIEILAGFDSTNTTIFKGILTGHSIRSIPGSSPELVIEARDSAVKMTIARHNATFVKKSDSEVMVSLIRDSGASSDVTATNYVWPELVQYYATDWDFLLARAEANGMYVVTDQDKVIVKKFETTASAATYTHGIDIFAFETGIDARRQLTAVSAQGWDYKTQAIVNAAAEKPTFPDQGNLTAASLTSVTAPAAFLLSTTAPLETDALKSWASAQLARSRFAKVRGTIKVLGNAAILPGNVITLAGMGARFNGDAFVSSVTQQIGAGDWFTTIATGIDDNWFVDKVRATAATASGLLPGVRGLVNATVKAMHEDPDGETRVQVFIPVISTAGDGIWARMANQYATGGAGFFWMPEVGDEVVVGFLNDDPCYPIIVGSLYSNKKAPPYTPDANNTLKAIYSKSKIYLEFNDDKKNLTITTPGTNKMIFSDENESITIQDQHGNKILMSDAGIKMTSPKDIVLEASGKVNIKGTFGVKIESSAAVDIKAATELKAKGMSVAVSADTQLSAKGGATAEFSSGGRTTLKGAIVMIN